jgi:hypothetical protein
MQYALSFGLEVLSPVTIAPPAFHIGTKMLLTLSQHENCIEQPGLDSEQRHEPDQHGHPHAALSAMQSLARVMKRSSAFCTIS